MTDATILALTHRIPSELRSEACLGESSTRMGDPLGSPRVASLLFFFPLKFGLILPVRSANLFVFPLGGNEKGGKAQGRACGV